MKITADMLRPLLVETGHVTEAQFASAVSLSEREGLPFEECLVSEGYIRERDLGKLIAFLYKVKYIELRNMDISDDVLHSIPEAVARAQMTVAYEKTKHQLKVATLFPDRYDFFRMLERKMGVPLDVRYAVKSDIEDVLSRYRNDARKELDRLARLFWGDPAVDGDEKSSEYDVVSFVDALLLYAYQNKASDIHIEPLARETVVRFRIDGALHRIVSYPSVLHEKIVSRVKILSHLRTDERFAAQDGRFTFVQGGINFDVRTSILPVVDGENIVLRLLIERNTSLFIGDIGLERDDLEKVNAALLKPNGMILTVGPTGSGKTTTLYTILKKIQDPGLNIMSIEDPVEYNMRQVQQIQVNEAKNITFSNGLRSIVRQDPDVIMVGEIRDTETAKIAINAAMTGHLILSSMHTNDAATTFPRLTEMGIEPFLVASALRIVIAQRLVRKICEHCKVSYRLGDDAYWRSVRSEALEHRLRSAFGGRDLYHMTFYRGNGCELCHQSGYSGRVGIFEVLVVTDEIRALIVNKAAAARINDEARRLGMVPLFINGLKKVERGVTTLQEALHVAYTSE